MNKSGGLIIDIITTLLESYMISYETNYLVNRKEINRKKLIISFILITILQSNMFLQIFKLLWVQCTVALLFAFVIIGIVYRENFIEAITVYLFCMLSISSISVLMQDNIYQLISNKNNFGASLGSISYFIVSLRWINAICQIKYKDYMYNFYKIILDEGKYLFIFLIILNVIAGCTICLVNPTYVKSHGALKSITSITFFIFFISLFFYIVRISSKSEQIYKLNSELELNNRNLRKIKHDYGAQISYLYGLCLMERYDDLKISIKNIIDTSNYSSGISEEKTDSILSLAISQAIEGKDIEVEINESAKLFEVQMPEMDLFRVFYNIVRNAVEAMEGKGKIQAKTYNKGDKIIIKIKNNGPKIPKKTIDKIFNTGFTTKENSEKGHGYGLSIVKELVEKSNGKITVSSTSDFTEFKIAFKIVNNNFLS